MRYKIQPEDILKKLGIYSPKNIDIDLIAYSLGAEIRRAELSGYEGQIVGTNEKAIITINSDASPQRQLFSAAHECGHWVNDRGKNLGYQCSANDMRQRFIIKNDFKQMYALGLGAIFLYAVVIFLAMANDSQSLRIFGNTVLISGAIFLSVGFVVEGYQYIKKLREKSTSLIPITLVGGFLGALVTLLSTLSAYHAVNRVTGLQPEYFSFSIAIFSLMYSPYIISLICAISFGLYMIWQLLFMVISRARSHLYSLVSSMKIETNASVSNAGDLFASSRLMASMVFFITFSSFSN